MLTCLEVVGCHVCRNLGGASTEEGLMSLFTEPDGENIRCAGGTSTDREPCLATVTDDTAESSGSS